MTGKIKGRLEGRRIGRKAGVYVRLTLAEEKAIEKEASRRGLAVSTVARELIFEALGMGGTGDWGSP